MLKWYDRARDPQFDDNPNAAAQCPRHPDSWVDDGAKCWDCEMEDGEDG